MTDNPTHGTGHDDSQRFHEHMARKAEEQFRRDMREASLLLSKGNSKRAIPLLERCLQYRPDDVNVLSNLGGAYILAGRHAHAVPVLEKATELEPDNPHVWSNLAAAYLGKLVISSKKKQDRALSAYKRVVALDASYPNVHYNMGLIYIDRRAWNEAHDAFTRAIEHNPHDKDAHTMRAKVEEIRSRPNDPANN